jgi:hypothetical protein
VEGVAHHAGPWQILIVLGGKTSCLSRSEQYSTSPKLRLAGTMTEMSSFRHVFVISLVLYSHLPVSLGRAACFCAVQLRQVRSYFFVILEDIWRSLPADSALLGGAEIVAIRVEVYMAAIQANLHETAAFIDHGCGSGSQRDWPTVIDRVAQPVVSQPELPDASLVAYPETPGAGMSSLAMRAIRGNLNTIAPFIDDACGSGSVAFFVIDSKAKVNLRYNVTHDYLNTLDPDTHRSLGSLSEEALIAELSHRWREGFQEG